MFVLGLTGGIASGKSTAAAWLTDQGACHIDADRIARQVVVPGSDGLQAVLARFGEHFRTANGELDRAALGSLVFADAAARRDLEALLHPRIGAGIDAELAAAAQRGAQLAVIDAALLFELGLDRRCHETWAITCQPETQVARLVARNGLSHAAASQRLAAQADPSTYRARATWTIDNDGSVNQLKAALAQRFAQLPLDPESRVEPCGGSAS